MNGFGTWRRNGLERRLRAERPVPPQHLVDEVVSRIEVSRPRSRSSFGRLGLAGVAATVMLMVFGAFGGVGFAASGVSGAASSTARAVSKLVKPDKAAPNAAARSNSANSHKDKHGDNGDDDNGKGRHECEDDKNDGAAEGEYCKPRVTICHVKKNGKQKTLTLPAKAAARHLAKHPNDQPGPCQNGKDDDD